MRGTLRGVQMHVARIKMLPHSAGRCCPCAAGAVGSQHPPPAASSLIVAPDRSRVDEGEWPFNSSLSGWLGGASSSTGEQSGEGPLILQRKGRSQGR